jgi:hypothetical protein
MPQMPMIASVGLARMGSNNHFGLHADEAQQVAMPKSVEDHRKMKALATTGSWDGR